MCVCVCACMCVCVCVCVCSLAGEAAQCSSGSAPEWDDAGKRLLVASSGVDLSSQVKLVRHGALR